MKSIVLAVASLFAVSAFAAEPAKKEEKKADAKPAAAAPAKKDEKKAEAKPAAKDAKKDEKKAEAKK